MYKPNDIWYNKCPSKTNLYSTHDIIHNPIEQQRDIKSLKSFKLLQSNIIVKGLFVLFANGISPQFNIELTAILRVYQIIYLQKEISTKRDIKWLFTQSMQSGPRFNIKMSSYQYRKSHCGNKTVVRSSYIHNGISYTGKMSSLYWIGALTTFLTIACQWIC